MDNNALRSQCLVKQTTTTYTRRDFLNASIHQGYCAAFVALSSNWLMMDTANAANMANAAKDGLTLLPPAFSTAELSAAFQAKTFAETLSALTPLGISVLQPSTAIYLTAPDIAENGAAVPITLNTSLPDVQSMLIIVEKNPTPLIAQYDLSPLIQPYIRTEIKMAQTSNVYALIKIRATQTTSTRWYFAVQTVRITLGGCGA
jgi:sulfur-oxidizing protein SoxY